jgi:nucleoside diphosphate kinase
MPRLVTAGLIKPDAIDRKLEQEIYKMINSANFSIYRTNRIKLDTPTIKVIYSHDIGKVYLDVFIKYLQKTEVEFFIAISKNGQDAIYNLRETIGRMIPESAREGTIRKKLAIPDYFKDCPGIIQNCVESAHDEGRVITLTELFFSNDLEQVMNLLYG